MPIFYSKREEEIYQETLDAITGKKNSADLILIKAFAVEMATYEEACEKLSKTKVTTRGTGGKTASPYIAIRNQAITNAQRIMKLLGMSELAKQEQPVAKVAKLDLLKNGKNKVQKTGS